MWSPDGRWIAFVSSTPRQLMRMPADGSAPPERVGGPIRHADLNAWSPHGSTFLFTQRNRGTGWDIGFSAVGGGEPRWVPSLQHAEVSPALSPDGRFMAYESNESGAFDIYVRPFPGPAGAKYRVSNGGGREPCWSRDGRELFYRSGGDRPKLMAVAVDTHGPSTLDGRRHCLMTPSGKALGSLPPTTSSRTADASCSWRSLQGRQPRPGSS